MRSPHGDASVVRVSAEPYANCRVHKNCADARCEFKRLSWELRAARDRAAARGRPARASAETWVQAAMGEDETWMAEGREERRRQQAAVAKVNRQMELAARTATTQKEERRERERERARERERVRVRGGAGEPSGNVKAKTEDMLTESEKQFRRAMEIYEERVNKVRHVLSRRALVLARGPSIEVDPVTSKVVKALNLKELQVALRRDAKKQNLLDRVRRSQAFLVPLKGPDLGDMYRCPLLSEELWLFEDEDAAEPTRADLIQMSVAM